MKDNNYLRSHFLTCYILILFTLLITSIPIYYCAQYSLRNMAKNQYKSLLTQVQSNIDMNLMELESVSFYIKHYNELVNLINLDNKQEPFYQIYKTTKEMQDFQLINSLIKQIYIFVENYNYIISPSGAVPCTEAIYNGLFDYVASDYNSFNDLVWRTQFNKQWKVFYSSNNEVNITFLHTIYNKSQPSALIFIQVDTNFIKGLIKKIEIGNESATYILDQNKNIIAHIGQNIPLDSKEYLITSVESSYNGWKYYTLVSNKYIFKNILWMQQLIITLTAIGVIFMGGIVSYLWTRKNRQSLKSVFNMLTPISNYNVPKYELYYLENTVATLVKKHLLLEESSKQYLILLQQIGLRQLLLGEMDSNDTMNTALNKLIIYSIDKKFLLIGFNSLAPLEEAKYTQIRQSIRENLLKESIYEFTEVQVNKSQCIFLLSTDKFTPNEDILEYINFTLLTIYEKIKKIYSSEIYFYISDFHIGFSNIQLAYKQIDSMQYLHCYYSAQNKIKYQNKIIKSLDLPNKQDLYYYPIAFEIELISTIKSKSKERLSTLLEKIYDENLVQRNLSPNMYHQLILSIDLTIIRSLEELRVKENFEPLLENLMSVDTLDQLFKLILELYELLKSTDLNEQNHEHTLLKQQILEYILMNYNDINFSIHDVGERFKMSTPSLYSFFKNYMPVSFGQLLEKIRIEKACELLLNKNLTINEISKQVGYTNDTSFRRAFKRVLGITPSMYIKSQIVNKNLNVVKHIVPDKTS